MFSKHFLKMLFGLIGMILLGILGLFVINAYENANGGRTLNVSGDSVTSQ